MIGTYYNEDRMQEWFVESLPIAKKKLEEFKALDKLFDGFKDYQTKRYRDTRNTVLHLCLPKRMIDPVKSGRRLSELEEVIDFFDVFSWNPAKLNEFRSRITSDDYMQSLTIYTELETAKRLADRLGKEKVKIFPEIANGFSDILVGLDGKVVYIEVGNLGTSLPEQKIQEILDKVAEHLGKKVKNQCYFSVSIDTAQLVFDREGHIDVDASVRKITSEIDRLCLDKLKGFRGPISLERIAYVVKNAENLRKIYSRVPLGHSIREDLDLIETPIVKSWIDSCKDQIIQGSRLFKGGIICGELEYLLVEIHTFGMFPSPSATAELKSFLRHFISHIEEQLNQLQPENPNIIIIQGYNWMLFGLGFELLYTRIIDFLNMRKEPYLSGVVVFGRNIDDAKYISNIHATPSSQLSKKDIERLGVLWLQQK